MLYRLVIRLLLTAMATVAIFCNRSSAECKKRLFTLRAVIDEYTYDKRNCPQSWSELVRAGYLQQEPNPHLAPLLQACSAESPAGH